MPGLVRKLLIVAAVEGLVLQPVPQRSQRAAAPVIIDYKSHTVQPFLRDLPEKEDRQDLSIEVHGVIGVLKIASAAYLIAISRRQQVAQIYGKPIYCITGVVILPVSSEHAAIEAIERARSEARQESRDGTDVGDDSQDAETVSTSEHEMSSSPDGVTDGRPSLEKVGRQGSGLRRDPGIAEEVINNKGSYGKFSNRWFSRRGWNTGAPGPSQSMSTGTNEHEKHEKSTRTQALDKEDDQAYQRWPQTPAQTPSVEKSLEDAFSGVSTNDLTTTLLPKLLNTTQLLFCSGTFFYSYEHDLTRDLSSQAKTALEVPLSRRVYTEVCFSRFSITMIAMVPDLYTVLL